MSRPQAPARAARPGGSDGRRAELIEAARRVIQRRGFAKATVGAITGEAGASLGLLNYHFDSRDDVVAEAFAAAARADLDELQAISRRHGDPPARLAAYLDLEAWADRDVWRMWIDAWGEAVHTEKLRRTLEQFERGWRAVLAGVLADGDRRELLALRGSRGRRGAPGRRARRAGAAHDAAPRRRRARGGGALGAPAGRARARRDAAGSAGARARGRRADAPRGAHPDPRPRPRRHRARAPGGPAHLRGRGARGVARRAPGRPEPGPGASRSPT